MGRRMLGAMELGLTGLGVVWLTVFSWSGGGIGLLLVWNLLAVAYMVAGWALLSRDLPRDPSAELDDWVGPTWYATTMAMVASGSGAAAGFIMIAAREGGGDALAESVAAATVLMSWLLLHTAFAQIYARAHYADGGLEFPHCRWPQLTEFVYFSFTVGTSFAVSDVDVVNRPMRRRVVAHSVLSFFFNAAVVAIAIDWLKG
ncbi:DUF1345 domain-containing protein [Nocardia neocaledoniensis]|uniref:DUF1345 domain-containing protein n=1 Tax=Nocardia neocaledoniensis TaxID=236511 RepID=UPI002455E9BD|nr:DUF1345 domain-containing protein [Nocardia neocaledoniensis]